MKMNCRSYAATQRWRAGLRERLAEDREYLRFEAFCREAGIRSSAQSSMAMWRRPGLYLKFCPTNPFAEVTTGFNRRAID